MTQVYGVWGNNFQSPYTGKHPQCALLCIKYSIVPLWRLCKIPCGRLRARQPSGGSSGLRIHPSGCKECRHLPRSGRAGCWMTLAAAVAGASSCIKTDDLKASFCGVLGHTHSENRRQFWPALELTTNWVRPISSPMMVEVLASSTADGRGYSLLPLMQSYRVSCQGILGMTQCWEEDR